MLISIDGEQQTEVTGEGRTLGEVLEAVRGHLAGSGRMIVSIECDGQVVPPEQVEQALGEQADKYWQIDFHTSAPAKLAGEALGATGELLNRVEELNELSAGMLTQGRVREAMEHLGQLFGAWNDVYRGVHNTLKLLGIDAESVETPSGNAGTAMNRLMEQLQGVKSALENQDFTQLADLLNYELAPLAKEWQGIVEALLERLADAGAGDVEGA
ncbi:MAG: hypothetical protein GXY33_01850 [Phycisphaerae bacterium]|nr:hypothetical protein [Phycisphaerae bacterium]